jgi:hypothetical protein
MRLSLGCSLVALALVAWTAAGAAEARELLSTPGETLAQSQAKAEQALAKSTMRVQVNTVGFDIQPGSEAEKYLQGTAQAGGGSYFAAADSGQLAAALGAAAAGATSVTFSPPTAGPDAVVITKPKPDEIVGPSIVVEGRTTPNALVVIYTICYPQTTDQKPQMVAGIRHRAQANGEFSFRIATPRVSFGDIVPVRYELHAYVLREDRSQGPETILNVYSPKP